MKISAIVLCLISSFAQTGAATAGYQRFAAYFGSNCDKDGDNPMLISAMYSTDCRDYKDQCFEFAESNTSGAATCSKSLTSYPRVYEPQDYFTMRVYGRSADCSSAIKKQAIQMRASEACIPNTMNEEPTEWVQAMCGPDGEHFIAVCEDEECGSCGEPYAFQDGACYQFDGLKSPNEQYSIKFTCTTLKPKSSSLAAIDDDAVECKKESLSKLPANLLKIFHPSTISEQHRNLKSSKDQEDTLF